VGSTTNRTSPWNRIATVSRNAASISAWRASVGRSSTRAVANAAVTNAGKKAFSVISSPV
jgi:hypothetical protein